MVVNPATMYERATVQLRTDEAAGRRLVSNEFPSKG